MLPRRPAQLFRSRWSALLWAAGVLWAAASFVGFDSGGAPGPGAAPEAATDALGQPIDNEDLAVLRNVIGN